MPSHAPPYALCALAVLLGGGARSAAAFSRTSIRCGVVRHSCAPTPMVAADRRRPSTSLLESTTDTDGPSSNAAADMTELEAARTRETPRLDGGDRQFVASLHAACRGDAAAMEDELAANLENMHPRLVVALQLAAEEGSWKDDDADAGDEEFEAQMVEVGSALARVLDVRLRSGRELLADLLKSGEIRKLDSMIGKAAKEGKLDMSFFSVLGMNIRDAALGEDGEAVSISPTLAQGEGQEAVEGEEGQPVGANRAQILQHIYTRCQEELEKNVAPGVGLLNKLLRTEISSIRTNQLQHYLGPQATTITSPDGTTIELGGTGTPLVSHGEFVEALANAVTQIRTLEAAGGTDRLSAVNLVESIRQVAKEARVVLVESFGEGSEAVAEFQKELQPVFRPGSKVES